MKPVKDMIEQAYKSETKNRMHANTIPQIDLVLRLQISFPLFNRIALMRQIETNVR